MSIDLKSLLNHTQKLSVLFAEDNYDVRIQLVKLLENFFSNINVEVDGIDALNNYNDYKNTTGKFYDLVITDISMPRFDGIDFCKRVIKLNPRQTILVISAHTESEKLLQLIDVGVFKFLQKPVDYRDLLNTISSISEKLKSEKTIDQLENEVKHIKSNNEILNKIAITDKLTSIYNRRHLDSSLIHKIEKIEKKEINDLSIIFLDIDNFKNVNDSFGHNIGDKILIEFSNFIKENIRADEIFGRWGGEEFIVICEYPLEKSFEIAERLRKMIESKRFHIEINITASFGLASYKPKESLSSFIQKADYSLYQAKRNGKNQVYLVE